MTIRSDTIKALFPLSRSEAHPEFRRAAADIARVLHELRRSGRYLKPDTLARNAQTTTDTVAFTLEMLPRLDVIVPVRDTSDRIVGAEADAQRRRGVWIGTRTWFSDNRIMGSADGDVWMVSDMTAVAEAAATEAARTGSTLVDIVLARGTKTSLNFMAAVTALRLADRIPAAAFSHLPTELAPLAANPSRMIEAAGYMDEVVALRKELARLEDRDAETLAEHADQYRRAEAGLRTRVEVETVITGRESVKRVTEHRAPVEGYWGEDRGYERTTLDTRYVSVPTFGYIERTVRDYPGEPQLYTRKRVEAEDELKAVGRRLAKCLGMAGATPDGPSDAPRR